MTIWNAMLLGLIQGIAEILPISSSGHLAIVNNLFKLSNLSEGHALFEALLYLSTMLSVCLVYWPELRAMYYELLALAGTGPLAGEERGHYGAARCFFMLAVATLPLFLVLPINRMIETLYGRNVFIGVMLILTGCLLFVSDKMTPGKKTARNMTITDALIIGLCQSVSTIPGLSRSAVSITAGIATGLRRDFAVNFSFLACIPAVFGAMILSFADTAKQGIDWASVPAYLIGMATAMISGIVAIELLKYISRHSKFGGFAYYCWVVGVLAIILTMIF
jgi:undecaprenyl-diphosphatase